ncbi:MAG: phosphatidylserine decarboxylase [Kineosporiaceae bacterium]
MTRTGGHGPAPVGYKRGVVTSGTRGPDTHRLGVGRFGVDRDGLVTAAAFAVLTGALGVRGASRTARLAAAVAGVALTLFFRDPNRSPSDDPSWTPDPDEVLAASDGRVLSVEEVEDPRIGPGRWLRIATFLSVLDVHVNRAPISGEVVAVRRYGGGYAMAQTEGAEHNVAAYLTLATDHGPVIVAQRTGLIARRIVVRTRVGDRLRAGQRFGLIRFGSRTDVYLPAGTARAEVSVGARVIGGRTPLARFTPSDLQE